MKQALRDLNLIVTAAENGFIIQDGLRMGPADIPAYYVATNSSDIAEVVKELCDEATNEED